MLRSLVGSEMCIRDSLYIASGAIAVVMLCFSQVKSLEELGWTAVFGVSSITVPIVIVFIHAFVHEAPAGDDTLLNTETTWGACMSNLVGGVVFAYSGQILFPNFIASMKEPDEFPKCVFMSSSCMFAIYMVVAGLGYALLGKSVKSPITSDLGKAGASVVAEIVLIFHVVVGYAISANVFNGFVFYKIFPEADKMSADLSTKCFWFLITLGTIAVAFVIANVIPVFSDIVNLQGSTLGVLITYNLPALMYLKLCKPTGARRTHVWFFFFLGLGLMVVGTLGSFDQLIKDLGKGGVFPCKQK
eukprot:TRINITY_DN56126_c0_g4_i1.p1 TRINITY_DN56126_c0_g4~~TRINITY_DN56126_c0_g4_i1.p1  ORF type:complete len:302 (+),score=89.12 TRINITY_DN56126_c0_g4_i1:114-1019(+)